MEPEVPIPMSQEPTAEEIQPHIRTRYGRQVRPQQRYEPSKGNLLEGAKQYLQSLLPIFASGSQKEQVQAHLASLCNGSFGFRRQQQRPRQVFLPRGHDGR